MKKIIESVIDGYAWPREWNRIAYTYGWYAAVVPTPPVWRRVLRGLHWGLNSLRESMADVIDPDGPRL